jgi:hypothetical protein
VSANHSATKKEKKEKQNQTWNKVVFDNKRKWVRSLQHMLPLQILVVSKT